MSKHRIKTIAVEDDYIDDDEIEYDDQGYEQGEEVQGEDDGDDFMTPEDQERLRVGTGQVRVGLGDQSSTYTDKEIQDTLWHYYYDVAKSIVYLKNKHVPNQHKQQTTKTTKASVKSSESHHHRPSDPFSHHQEELLTAKSFFHDAPWLNIPACRKTEILVEPLFLRRGLLGGSSKGDGKMSKLAALAAKRRKVEEEKQQASCPAQDSSTNDSVPMSNESALASRNLFQSSRDRLLNSRKPSEPKDQSSKPLEHKVHETDVAEPERKEEPTSQAPDRRKDSLDMVDVTDLQAAPSAFARTLLGGTGCVSAVFSEKSDIIFEPLFHQFDFSKPSPDDVVLRAQNWKGSNTKTTTPSKQPNTSNTKQSVQSGMKELSITHAPKVKSKKLDVLAEYEKVDRKRTTNFVVIGHVDSGKSTLMGRLLFDLKAINQRTMDRYKKEAEQMGKGSFAFAWILDQGTEERARGVTMDIAAHQFETDRTVFTILDAPGHRDFVPSMIAGASEADFAVLVIDASTGEFEAGLQGQTKEHVLLVRSMGCSRLVVAVNKMDRIEWSRDRFQDIQQQMLAFFITAGFKKDHIAFVPCSGLLGNNILNRGTDAKGSWYSGPTLVQELDNSEPVRHALDRPLRMILGEVLQGSSSGPLLASGRIEAGSLQVGDEVILMPGREHASVRSIQVDEQPADWAVAGQNVTLNLTEIEEGKVKVGDVLCGLSSPVRNTKSFTAKLLAFDHLMPMPVDVHKGHLHVPGRISKLMALLDKGDGSVTKKKPKVVHPGSTTRVEVELEDAAPIEGGRIILRADGASVAAGLVE